MIEFDTETTGLQWYANHLFLTQFLTDQSNALPHPECQTRIQERLLRGDDYRAWNAKFDLHFLDAAGYELPPETSWHDGMVMAHIIDERRSAALFARADDLRIDYDGRKWEKAIKDWLTKERKVRREVSKETGKQFVFPNYSDVPDDIMLPYAVGDVKVQREVCQVYENALSTNDELRDVYEMERGVLAALFHVEKRGLPIDRSAAAAFEARLLDQLEETSGRCVELAGIPTFNPRSSDQIEEALRRRGADLTFVTKSSKTGKLSMDADNLATVDDELATAVMAFRSADKSLNTYIHPMLHETVDKTYGPRAPFLTDADRIHSNYRQVGARTARMSSSDPNVQNWHRDDLRLRYLVEAGEGNVLVSADLDAIEMRIFAALCGEGRLLDAIRSGADMHTMTADEIGLSELVRGEGVVESRRQRGKKFNYSVAYGAGVRRVRKDFRANQNRAREMLFAFHDAYPEVGQLQDTIEFTLEDQGYVRTAWGRRHRVERSAEREAYKFVARLVQGTAADLFKDALVKLHARGVPIVGCFHDEFVAECATADAEEVSRELVRALTEFGPDEPGGKLTKVVPLEADAQIVHRWSEAKDPDFEPDYITKGSP